MSKYKKYNNRVRINQLKMDNFYQFVTLEPNEIILNIL